MREQGGLSQTEPVRPSVKPSRSLSSSEPPKEGQGQPCLLVVTGIRWGQLRAWPTGDLHAGARDSGVEAPRVRPAENEVQSSATMQ